MKIRFTLVQSLIWNLLDMHMYFVSSFTGMSRANQLWLTQRKSVFTKYQSRTKRRHPMNHVARMPWRRLAIKQTLNKVCQKLKENSACQTGLWPLRLQSTEPHEQRSLSWLHPISRSLGAIGFHPSKSMYWANIRKEIHDWRLVCMFYSPGRK